MPRPLRRLLAGAALLGATALLAPPASASLPPRCQEMYVGRFHFQLCRPV